MPRRNKPLNQPKQRASAPTDGTKTAYKTRREAERAIQNAKIYSPDLSLRAYKSATDGKWRLTSTG